MALDKNTPKPLTAAEIDYVVNTLATTDNPQLNAFKLSIDATGLTGEQKDAFAAKAATDLAEGLKNGFNPDQIASEASKEKEKTKQGLMSTMAEMFGGLLKNVNERLSFVWDTAMKFAPDPLKKLFEKPAETVMSIGVDENTKKLQWQQAGAAVALGSTGIIDNGKFVGLQNIEVIQHLIANAHTNGLLVKDFKTLDKDNNGLDYKELVGFDKNGDNAIASEELPPAVRAQFAELLKSQAKNGVTPQTLDLSLVEGFTPSTTPTIAQAPGKSGSKST